VDVFLVPVQPAGRTGTPEFALYCEPAPDTIEPDVEGAARPGLFARWARSFRQAMAEGEAEQRRREAGDPEQAGGSRIGRLVRRKLAEAVAEHRLLWALRHHESARLLHPDAVTGDHAIDWAVTEFKRDFSKHRLWCAIDAVIVIASTPFALVPGPNVLAYYFIFRAVGHYFSLLGARRGMRRETWNAESSRALTTVGAALTLGPQDRDARIDAAARELGLERLTAFVRRIVPGQSPV
jgi:hypothetical protein